MHEEPGAAPPDDPEPDGRSAVPPPPWASARTRRSKRAARPPLDRPQIVAAALRIVDGEGIEALSLRRLADDLGITAMSIYWHVRDKAELLDLVGEAVFAGIEVPPARGDWREQLRDVHRSMFAGLLRHPNTADALAGRPRFSPGGLALFERILSILLGAGLTPEAAFDAYMSLYRFTLGFVATATRTPEFTAVQREGLAYMLTLPADRFPSIRSVAPVIGRRSIAEDLEIGLEVEIEGIAARLAPHPEG